MTTETLRQQGADACRAFFAEMGEDLAELSGAGHGGFVTRALTVRAIAAAAEAVGIYDTVNQIAFAEGYVEQAIAEIQARRDRLPIVLP